MQTKDKGCHWGAEALVTFLKRHLVPVKMLEIAKMATAKCEICLKNHPVVKKKVQMGILKSRMEPGDYWQIDFSELPRQNSYQYILVRVGTSTGWSEAFPCWTNQAKEVINWLLQELIPNLGCLFEYLQIEVHILLQKWHRVLVKCWELLRTYIYLEGHNPVQK